MTHKIGLIADAQLGKKQYGMLTRVDDYAKAFEWAVVHLIEIGCQELFLLGDTFNSSKPSMLCLLNTIDALRYAKDKAKVYPVIGNHDDISPESVSPLFLLSELGYLSPPPTMSYSILHWSGAATGENLARLIAEAQKRDGIKLLFGHAGLETKTMGSGIIPNTLVDPMVKTFDLVALGHTHQRYAVGGKIISPGPLETTAYGEWACGPAVIEIADNGQIGYGFIDYPNARPFLVIDCKATDDFGWYLAEVYPDGYYEGVRGECIAYVITYPNTDRGKLARQLELYNPLRIIENYKPGLEIQDRKEYRGSSSESELEAYRTIFGDKADQARALVEMALSGSESTEIISQLTQEDK